MTIEKIIDKKLFNEIGENIGSIEIYSNKKIGLISVNIYNLPHVDVCAPIKANFSSLTKDNYSQITAIIGNDNNKKIAYETMLPYIIEELNDKKIRITSE